MTLCAKCHKPIAEGGGVVDHIIPISRGGTNDPDNTRVMHRSCHLNCKRNRLQRFIGKALCFIGRHKWLPVKGTIHLDWRSKWEAYEVADGFCQRFGCRAQAEIRRDYYW